ncbi:DUF2381 family protein [Stigmatella aurantiaca]|uniref:Uncharacterized protein n=1 Tax=Stigmatella aurantiaca (strain DW4/3-1) TaxID=378806 RepID=E3FRI2_STIAD|nr:DUF2381 family protein [Stigmatella aurantiaca]ADO75759.1 uncharacterized protein STAUR_8004 [Stigmatella aurantiaca DW4/3-1]
MGTAALAQPHPEAPPVDVHALRQVVREGGPGQAEGYQGASPLDASPEGPSGGHAGRDAQQVEQAVPPREAQGLTGLIALGILGEQGVRVMTLSPEDWTPPGMTVRQARLYVATGWMALEVTLSLARGELPWTPGEAVVDHWQSEKASPKVAVRLLEGTSLLPGGSARMVVEWEAPTEKKRLRCKLIVSEQGGARAFNVTELSVAAPPPDASRGGGRP